MKSTSRRLLFAAVAIGGSLGLVLGILEAGVRMAERLGRVYPLVYYDTADPAVTLWCYDGSFNGIADHDLREAHPYRSIRYHGTEGLGPGLAGLSHLEVPLAVEVRLNANGFRERPFDELRKLGDLTLVVGDSFCFGQGVRLQDRLTERMAAGGAGTFANLCRASADIEEIATILESGLEELPNASRVVYVYNLNDPVRDVGLEREQLYINDLMHVRGYNVVRVLPSRLRLLGRSALLRWVLGRVYGARVSAETEAWYARLHQAGPGWEATAAVFRRMAESCRRRSVPFVVACFPLLHELDDYPFSAAHRRVAELGRAEGIPVADLLPAFAGRDARELQVHPTDFHPNYLAHELAAAYLAPRLYVPGTGGAPGNASATGPTSGQTQ